MHLKKLVTLVLGCFIAVAVQAQDIKAELYFTTSYKAAIFPDSFPVKGLDERFTPKRAQVDKGEKALSRDLFIINAELENQDPDYPIHRRLLQYKRQYFGFVNEDGDQILKIVAYLKSIDDENFLTQERTMEAGTSDNWVVYYNLDTNELFDLAVGRGPVGTKLETVKLVDRIETMKVQRGAGIDSTEVQKVEQPVIDIED